MTTKDSWTAVRSRFTLFKAVLIFFGFLAFFFWALNNGWVYRHILAPYSTWVALVATGVFKLFGQAAARAGPMVTVGGTSLSIATGCNGAEAMALYFSAVLAFPAGWKSKSIGMVLGSVGIFIINQIRVLGLFFVAMLKPEFLPEAHNYAGQTFVIVMGMACWWFWAERFTERGDAKNVEAGR